MAFPVFTRRGKEAEFFSIFHLMWVEETESVSMKSSWRERSTSPGFKVDVCLFKRLERKCFTQNSAVKFLCSSLCFSSYIEFKVPPQLHLQGSLWTPTLPKSLLCTTEAATAQLRFDRQKQNTGTAKTVTGRWWLWEKEGDL